MKTAASTPEKQLILCFALVLGSLTSTTVAGDVSLALIPVRIPVPTDETLALPPADSNFDVGEPIFVELWASTVAVNGLSQVSADLQFDPSRLTGVGIIHTALFGLFANGTIDNVQGTVDDLSGSVPPTSMPPCAGAVGATGWARVATVEMLATSGGSTAISIGDSNSPIFVVVICGGGAAPVVDYFGTSVTVDDVTVALIAVSEPSASDQDSSLPTAQSTATVGDTVLVEVWAQTVTTSGLSTVALDVHFDPTLLSAVAITHTPLFNLFLSGSIDNSAGVIDNLTGSHLSAACGDQVGLTPMWARVAIIEMEALAFGVASVVPEDSNDIIFVTVNCGGGSVPTVEYQIATVSIADPGGVPATSEWGLGIMTTLLLVVATVVFGRVNTRATDIVGRA